MSGENFIQVGEGLMIDELEGISRKAESLAGVTKSTRDRALYIRLSKAALAVRDLILRGHNEV